MQNQIIVLRAEMPIPELEPVSEAGLVGVVTMQGDDFIVCPGLLSEDRDIEFYTAELDINLLSILLQGHIKKVMAHGSIAYPRRARVKVYCHNLSPGVLSTIHNRVTKWKCEGYIFNCEEVESDHIE